MVDEQKRQSIERVFKFALGSSIDAVPYRKKLTEGNEPVYISYQRDTFKKNFKVEVEKNKAKIRIGEEEYISIPFVPYDEADKDYTEALANYSNGSDMNSIHKDSIINAYFDRFPEGF